MERLEARFPAGYQIAVRRASRFHAVLQLLPLLRVIFWNNKGPRYLRGLHWSTGANVVGVCSLCLSTGDDGS